MKDTVVVAKLIDYDVIRLTAFYNSPIGEIKPILVIDGKSYREPLKIERFNSTSNLSIYELRCSKPLELGEAYFIEIPGLGRLVLDVNEAISFKDFDKRYTYDGELGSIYTKEKTIFRLFAPLASSVVLRVLKRGEKKYEYYLMKRLSVGVYEMELEGDYKLATYNYFVSNSGTRSICVDPYAKASTPNGKASVVIDINDYKVPGHYECLPVLNSPVESIIYETSVRDFTVNEHTDIVHKGQYLGLTEKNRKTKGGLPAGLDYLKSLGITHLQILPMYDFATVDELHPKKSYNWGYDPAQYFVPEGSFASHVEDPENRIIECQKMVDALHEEGIRVVMDVVYNHVYSYESSNFEKVVPGYYFRHRNNGRMASTSGCGNDLASERPMVRRLIVDSALFWIDFYGVDGFRFDLMGIIDCETLNIIATEAKKRKKDFILYGEGWNMGGEVNFPLGTMGNYKLLPKYGFFNDFFRESIKGLCFGDDSKRPSAMFSLVGSCVDFSRGAMFDLATRTINYTECHDNGTFYDYLKRLRPYLNEEDTINLCKLGLAFVIFSIGVPFIHAGQEIAGTKKGHENSYNLSDEINQFDYARLEKYQHLYEFTKAAIALRKKTRVCHLYHPENITSNIDIADHSGAIIAFNLDPNLTAPDKKHLLIFNPQSIPVGYECNGDVNILLCSSSKTTLENNKIHLPGFGFAFLSLN